MRIKKIMKKQSRSILNNNNLFFQLKINKINNN